ncbi:MAG: hypothetical protein FWD25_02160 [Clostridia bacterium]|nr:hypothetical protein [Clostridia bacterium]
MSSKTAIDFRNPVWIHKAGMSVLQKELGIVGAIDFLRQFSVGKGDYTAEREQLFREITLDEVIKSVRAMETEMA